jgi:hypothetical protein
MSDQPALRATEVNVDLRVGDVYWLIFWNTVRKLIYARWILIIALIVLVAFGSQYLRYPGVLLEPPLLYLLLGGVIYVLIIWPYIRARAYVRKSMGPSGSLTCVIGTRGIDIRDPAKEAHYDWEKVRSARQTSQLVLLHFDGPASLIIPKRCFVDSEQLKDARSLIAYFVKKPQEGGLKPPLQGDAD